MYVLQNPNFIMKFIKAFYVFRKIGIIFVY